MVGFGTAFEAVHYALFGQAVGKVSNFLQHWLPKE